MHRCRRSRLSRAQNRHLPECSQGIPALLSFGFKNTQNRRTELGVSNSLFASAQAAEGDGLVAIWIRMRAQLREAEVYLLLQRIHLHCFRDGAISFSEGLPDCRVRSIRSCISMHLHASTTRGPTKVSAFLTSPYFHITVLISPCTLLISTAYNPWRRLSIFRSGRQEYMPLATPPLFCQSDYILDRKVQATEECDTPVLSGQRTCVRVREIRLRWVR